MNLDRYSFIQGSNSSTYEFFSEGPIGIYKKIVHFGKIRGKDEFLYNLAFGDWIDDKENFDDKVVTNNHDRDKVLATIAAIVIYFLEENPNAILFAKGSTPSRTRLYQMGINKYLNEISELFVIHGYRFGRWELFEKSKSYGSFLLRNKKSCKFNY